MASDERRGLLRRLLLSRATLVAGSLLACFGLGEAGLRLLGWIQGFDYRLYAEAMSGYRQIPLGLFCDWPGYPYLSLCPNFAGAAATADYAVVYQTNSRGLRDREYAAEKPPGVLRILALGDSFTFGSGIAYGQRFTDLLESAFDDVEVITMAVPGSGQDQQLVQFVYEGLALHPDQVFVFVTGATLHPMRHHPSLVREGRVEVPVFDPYASRRRFPTLEQRIAKSAERWPFWRRSHALGYLAFRLQRAAIELRYRGASGGAAGGSGGVEPGPSPDGASQERASLPPDWVARATPVFRKLVEVAAANGIQVTFVNLDPSHQQDYLGRIDGRARYLDLQPALAPEAARGRLGFRYDAHFNPQANALIGAELVRFVRAERAGAHQALRRGDSSPAGQRARTLTTP